MSRTAFLLALLLSFAAIAQTLPVEAAHAPVEPETFPIFPWDILKATKESYAQAKECGFNLAGFVNADNLDLVQSAGLKCFVSSASIKIRDNEKVSDDEITATAKEVASKASSHPATFGYHLLDEPSRQLVPTVARWTRAFDSADPKHLAYVNFLPMAIPKDDAGYPKVEADWEAYLTGYIEAAHPKAFSYDNYVVMDDGSIRPSFYSGLEVARRVSQKTNTPFWFVALANSHFRYAEPTPATLRFQAFSALAYSARGIGWFTFTGRDRGNYRNTAIDLEGNRTPTFAMLRDVNFSIHRLAPMLTKMKSVNVFHHPAVPKGSCRGLESSKFLADVKGRGRFVVGEFEDADGKPALLVVNRDIAHSADFTIVPKTHKTIIRISSKTGVSRPWGAEDNWLAPGEGILLLLR